MNDSDFKASLAAAEPPDGLSLALKSLWWEAKGDWKRAHTYAQEDRTPAGSRVHAHLHRAEGDLSNAEYWYRRAGRPLESASLQDEWDALARELWAVDASAKALPLDGGGLHPTVHKP